MDNLLKEDGNNFDLDMDVLLRKSMVSVDEDENPSKKESKKIIKGSKKETFGVAKANVPKENINDVLDEAPTETSESVPVEDRDLMSSPEMNENQKSDEFSSNNESSEEAQIDESSLSNEIRPNDSSEIDSPSDSYDARFLSDCPLDEDSGRIRINNGLLQKVKVILWFNPSVSVSSYVNNVLREHLRQNQSILEQRMKEISATIIDRS